MNIRSIVKNHWEVLFNPEINLKILLDDVISTADSLKT